MKKIFAIWLAIAVLLCGFTCPLGVPANCLNMQISLGFTKLNPAKNDIMNTQSTPIFMPGTKTPKPLQPGKLDPIWFKTWGGVDIDVAESMAIDSSDVYVTGSTESYGAGGRDAFILRYDLNGNLLRNETWGGTGTDLGHSITIGNSNIYVAGGTNSYGVGFHDAFILKYDLKGNYLWNKTWGSYGNEWASSIAVDGSNIYVAGGGDSFGAGMMDIFILKYDLNGNYLWNRTWGGSQDDYAHSIAVDGSNIYVAGGTHSYGAGGGDVLLLKYDLNGNLLLNKTWGGGSGDGAYSIAIDNSNIYVAGVTYSYDAGGGDALVLKCDKNGNEVWNRTWGTFQSDFPNPIAVDSSNIYVAGQSNSYTSGNYDAFVLKYDSNGNLLWAKTWGGNEWDAATSIAVDIMNIYVAGYTESYGAGSGDAFVLKCDLYGSSGNKQPSAIIDSISPNPAIQGQIITFTGHGTDPDGTITEYNWTSNIDGKLNSSASISTSTLSVGTHTIYFSVKDNNNSWSPEQSQTLVVNPPNQPPTAYIDSITPNPAVQGQRVTFKGHGTDSDGAIMEYNWISSIDGKIGTSAIFSTLSLSVGVHTITFTVKDNNDTWSQGAAETLTINPSSANNPPTCTISSPSSGSTVSGTAHISGTASDSDGTVQKVEIRIDSGDWFSVSGTTSWSYSWDTTKVSNGQHAIEARAYDGLNYSSVVSIDVSVSNGVGNGGGNNTVLIIAGIAIAVILAVAILIVILYLRRKKGSAHHPPPQSPEQQYQQ